MAAQPAAGQSDPAHSAAALRAPPPGGHHRRLDFFLRFSLLGLLGIHFLATLFPSNWTWGFNYPGELPAGLWITALLAAAVLLIPRVAALVQAVADRQIRLVASSVAGRWPAASWLVFTIGCFAFLYVHRVQTFFLGDAFVRRHQLIVDGTVVSRAPLDAVIFGRIPVWLDALTGMGRASAMQAVSAGFGVAFGILTWRLTGHLTDDPARRVWLWLIVCSGGYALVFFGHPEVYSATLALGAGVLLTLAARPSLRRLLIAGLLCGVSVLVHPAAVIFGPVLVYVALVDGKWGGPLARRRLNLLLLGVAAYAVICLVYRGLGLPLSDRVDATSLFAPWRFLSYLYKTSFLVQQGMDPRWWAHPVDVANLALLMVPTCVTGILLTRVVPISFDRFFWFILVVPVTVAAVIYDPLLGPAKDWDLFALPAFLISLVLAAGVEAAIRKRLLAPHLLVSLAAVAIVHSALWVGVQQQQDSATRWVWERLQDRSHPIVDLLPSELMWVGSYHFDAMRFEEAAAAFLLAHQVSGIDDHRRSASRVLTEAGKQAEARGEIDEALRLYRRAITADETFFQAHNDLGVMLHSQRRLQEAYVSLQRAVELAPDNETTRENLSVVVESLMAAGDSTTARRSHAASREIEDPRQRLAPARRGAGGDDAGPDRD